MIFYVEIFSATFILSTIFAMGGVGSAIALVPFLNFMSLPLNFAKSIGLFVNTATTLTASWMNFKKRVLDFKFAIPLIISGIVLSPLGAQSSRFINEDIVKFILIIFLIISGSLLLFYKKKQNEKQYDQKWILYLAGGVVAFISGLLGIGGGSFLVPILLFLGYDVKKVAVAISFVIPFSTGPAFLSYLPFTHIDWIILSIAFVGAITGGFLGNHIMHSKMKPDHIKGLIGIFLLILAGKMMYSLF